MMSSISIAFIVFETRNQLLVFIIIYELLSTIASLMLAVCCDDNDNPYENGQQGTMVNSNQ